MAEVLSVEQLYDALFPGADANVRTQFLSVGSRENGGYAFAGDYPKQFTPAQVVTPGDKSPQRIWELTGLFFLYQNRLYEAIAVFESLYRHMLCYQCAEKRRTQKGMPLCWISDAFLRLSYPIHSKRYLMYTLCEDAAEYGPEKRVEGSGVYFRALWQHGLSDELVTEYTRKAHEKLNEAKEAGWFPERLLAELDDRWMTESPTELEYGRYWSNPVYVRYLMGQLGSDKGNSLEWLAHYLVSMIPGCRAYRRRRSESTDYDVVGSFEGPSLDFRSELGRYFVCECKDWSGPADFTTFAKLARVLDSVKSRFGILFSKKGISGEGKTLYAEREQLKVFADRGIAIVVITEADLERVAAGESFLSMLRTKYETVRLDIAEPSRRGKRGRAT
jgi:hypothetical protein